MIESFDHLITFLHNFHAPLGQHLPSDDIPNDLPQPLARLYAEFGSLIEMELPVEQLPFSTQDHLTPVKYLKKIDNTYEFAWENQGNWSCRTPIDENDPPVYSNSRDVWEESSKGFQLVCDSLEHFLTTLCLQEAVMGSPKFTEIDIPVHSKFRSTLEPLWLNGIYVNGEPSHDFYTYKNLNILVMELKYEIGSGYIGSYTSDIKKQIKY